MIDFITAIFKFLMGMIGFAVFIIVIGFIARAYYALFMLGWGALS